jgi:hypothetical protein
LINTRTDDFSETKVWRSAKWGLKKKWIEEIVRNRLYNQSELDELFQREVRENCGTSLREMQMIWREVLKEINFE